MQGKNARKLTALLLAVSTALSLMSVSAFAAEQEPTDGDTSSSSAVQWTVSKSKTATELTTDGKTTVTLSLPAAETELSSDIVFVLDKSSCAEDTAKSAGALLTEMEKSLASTEASLKVGLVAFDGTSHKLFPMATYTGDDKQKTALAGLMTKNQIPAADHVSGTNMQAGLDAAHDMLDEDSSVLSSRKYVVLVSDGLPRLFSVDGAVKDIYYQYSYADMTGKNSSLTPTQFVYFGMIDEWDQVRNQRGNTDPLYQLPYGSWDTYFSKVQSWVEKDGDTYALDFSKYGNDPTSIVKDSATGAITDTNFKYIGHLDYEDHAMSVDRAVYEAYNSYQSMVTDGYQCFAVPVVPEESKTKTFYPFESAFMGALNKLSGHTGTVDFDSIQNGIKYLLGSGTVTDEIGPHFDLVTASGTCPFKLTVGGTELASSANGTNAWNFGAADAATGLYPYTVQYLPASGTSKEQFVWTINVPVDTTSPVQLSYQEQLVNKETAAGTYTVPTNGDTVLTYWDSLQDPKKDAAKTDAFTSPTVTYTVASSSSSGGTTGGGGTVIDFPTDSSSSQASSETVISEPSTPLASLPSSAAASEAPASSGSGTSTEISEPETPKSNVPATGDTAAAAASAVVAAISLAGLLIVLSGGRKHDRKA
jgi:hypothetical protein